MSGWALEIDRADITRAWLTDVEAPALAEGDAEFALDLAALTANNVTYAALGAPTPFLGKDAGYWDFFAERHAPGRVPVWGFATVTRSSAVGIAEGDRFYGYWPLASHAVMQPGRVDGVGFTEVSARRAKLPALYNSYQRIAALDGFAGSDERLWPVWRPLYITGWLIADQLIDEGDHGADAVLVTAASSKTALAFAHAMQARDGDRPLLVALTSPRSRAFVAETGLYDAVVTYDAIDGTLGDKAVLVDFANDGSVVAAVRAAFGERLVFDLVVGFTHWDATPVAAGVQRSGFFAPARLAKRNADWGGATVRARLAEAWDGFLAVAPSLVAFDERAGADAAKQAWSDMVSDRADPRRAILIRP
ncbi:DUF2855 family protein [Sphingomonas radiodurans]|uniref:DUF2855 family protein n=1 Tax=Sphingomonas radiodurans TaxID=2890321 RepID=UPI001E58F681|nr:DUF2855 family protein [Sphingomonas radiodurans]WBH15407.1 DUF2855 family protein [Sphingomonas radiodurans]